MSLLTFDEEFKIRESITEPELSYFISTIENRKKVSYLVLNKKIDEILLIGSSGFLIDSVFAGLSEKHLEYIAKNSPADYKKNILSIVKDTAMMKGVFEIAKAMDDDLGEKVIQNQQRINNLIRYIKDNQIIFEF